MVKDGEGSGHSKFAPMRVERALRWNSGSFVGPVFKIDVELKKMPTNGKSSPFGELESWTAEALINPYGVTFTAPVLNAATRPSFLGGSIGSVRIAATAGTTPGAKGPLGRGSLPAASVSGCGFWTGFCGCMSVLTDTAPAFDAADGDGATNAGPVAGAASGVPTAAKSAAFNRPLRLSASIRRVTSASGAAPRIVFASAGARIPLATSTSSKAVTFGLGAGVELAVDFESFESAGAGCAVVLVSSAAVLFAFAVSSAFAKTGATGTLASSRMHIHLFRSICSPSAGAWR